MGKGIVYLVGAGPGDPGLITVKGLKLVETSDAIVYDRLVDKRILQHARSDAVLIDVGKVPGKGANRQSEINARIVELAKSGKSVVRLKGGDPFVFGRGGEEAEILRDEGIAFEVVPGVTSAIAAPAYAGIPLTHRKYTSSFTVVTGNEDPEKSDSAINWDSLANQDGTLVVLMGWENLASIAKTLMAKGRGPDTPVSLVQWGTEPHQRTITGTLSTIAEKALESGLNPPVVTIIGDVVSLRESLRWFDNRPLFGKRVLVTRTRTQAGVLSEMLTQRGAQAIELPTIEIQRLNDYSKLDDALEKIKGYEWIIFTSTNAVDVVLARMQALEKDARAFYGLKIGAIGPATAKRLREGGLNSDFIPESFVSESVVEGLKEQISQGTRVLLPRANIARDALSKGLSELGAEVEELTAYKTIVPKESGNLLGEILSDGIDIATFTSSSTARNLYQLLDGNLEGLSDATIACIGPITAATARELGLEPDIVSEEHTVPGLVYAIESHFSQEEVPL